MGRWHPFPILSLKAPSCSAAGGHGSKVHRGLWLRSRAGWLQILHAEQSLTHTKTKHTGRGATAILPLMLFGEGKTWRGNRRKPRTLFSSARPATAATSNVLKACFEFKSLGRGRQERDGGPRERGSTAKYLVSRGIPLLLGPGIQNGYCKARERKRAQKQETGHLGGSVAVTWTMGEDTVEPPCSLPPTPLTAPRLRRHGHGQRQKSVGLSMPTLEPHGEGRGTENQI